MKTKILNLNKYAYLDYLKGDIFAWLNCNENFQNAANEDLNLRSLAPWRYDDEEEVDIEDDNSLEYNERYGVDFSKEVPDQMKAGIRVGEFSKLWAKVKFPNHEVFEVNKNTNLENVEYTKQLLEDNENVIIFEATFGYKGFHIRTDLLIKTGNVVKIVEVKATTKPKEIHGYDIFFQKEIIERGNPEFIDWDYSLLILNKEYIHSIKYSDEEIADKVFANIDFICNGTLSDRKVHGEDYKVKWTVNNNIHYFNNLDLDEPYPTFVNNKGRTTVYTFPIDQFLNSRLVEELQEKFEEDLLRIEEIQLMDVPPVLEFEDRNNKFMRSDFMVWALNHSGAYNTSDMSIFDVRGLLFNKKVELFKEGKLSLGEAYISDISGTPFNDESEFRNHNTYPLIEEFLKTDMDSKFIPKYKYIIQKHFRNIEDTLMHKQGIQFEMSKYDNGPIYMYDFETANLAIPVADGTSPYEQVVYQYSIHVILDPNDFDFQSGKNIVHYEWLAENRNDFHIDAWKNFIKVFKEHGEGVYVAWNMSFEKGCISRAQTELLDKDEMDLFEKIGLETVDLMVPFQKKYYYHKDLKGSYSIKYAGPHFANEIQYKELKNVQKGDQSAAVAKKWLRDNSEESEQFWLSMRKDMLKYCEYDTLLMVAILQRMKEKLVW